MPIMVGFLDAWDPLTMGLSGADVTTFGFEVGSTLGVTTAVFVTTSGDLTISHDFTNYDQSFIYAVTGAQILSVDLTTTDTWGPAIGAFRYADPGSDPVPEPATLALLGAGLLALGSIRLRRAKKTA